VANVPAFLVGAFPVRCAQYAAFLNEVGATLVDGYAHIGHVVAAADVSSWLTGRDAREARHGVGICFDAELGWSPFPECGDLPVTLVTWFGAQAYTAHFAARLPSEVEWEKAARGEHGLCFPWGDQYVPNNANLSDHWAGHPVDTQAQWDADFSQNGTGPAWLASRPNASGAFPNGLSPYGVEDMVGNVAEWCEDVYDASSEGGRADFRTMRGAGRYGYSAIARCATRRRRAPESVGENLGFRIVVDSVA
jgi:formylglycine-generating enzyme required for sulfatase activity